MTGWFRVVLPVLLGLVVAGTAAAQEADVLTGQVVGVDGEPVAGARVEVMSVETELIRSVVTNDRGRYLLIFPDGGGIYMLRVTFLGMGEAVQMVMREGQEELLVTNVTLSPQVIEVEGVTVRAQAGRPTDAVTGEQRTDITLDMMQRLPLPDLDPETLALLAEGVIATELDSLTGQMGFSVAGMSDVLNQVMIDGVLMGEDAMGIPEEGMRRAMVTTNTFDASRGGFAGGLVTMTTARGRNRPGGSLSYRIDDDALQLRSTPVSNSFTRHNFGGSWGGPLIENELFYNVSFQFRRNINHRFALAAGDPLAAERSGVAVDSIARFVDLVRIHSVPLEGTSGRYNQLSGDLRLQGRLDWNILQSQDHSQTLSMRFNTNLNHQDSTRISALDISHHGGDSDRNNRLVAVNLTSRFNRNWTNRLSFSFNQNHNETIPYLEMPQGQVRVTSEFDDGTRSTRTMVFGGNRAMPSEAFRRNIQASNDLSLLLNVGDQIHRLKVGGSIERARDRTRSAANIFGSFRYPSLADFEANTPDRYERMLSERETESGRLNAGLYVGNTWRVTVPLELTMGLRWDYSMLDQRPEYNPAVEDVFGRRTDIVPSAAGWSPRLGFNYRVAGDRRRSLSGGIGYFAGRAPTNIFNVAVRQTGLPGADERLLCLGDAVPDADWELFLNDPGAIPGTCRDGTAGTVFSSRAPTVTLIDPDQSLPSSVRFNLGYRTVLPLEVRGNFTYTHSRGIGLWGYQDINLNTSQAFALGNDGRPFFGTPASISARTGAVSSVGSRNDTDFAQVYDVISDRKSSTHQFSTRFSGMLPPDIRFNLNYTLGYSRDQASGSFAGATTVGNPNEAEWGVAANDRRHTANLTLQYAVTPEFEIGARGRLSSGSPFTPMINRDINGDGARNDRAFVFDPGATADTALADGMTRLLAVVPDRVRQCLESQFGQFADRNSCRNAWTPSLDLSFNVRPNLPRFERRITVSADVRNVLTGLDHLFHSRDNLKGWGEGQRADPNLLEVHGFDQTTNSFIYRVNEGFGQDRRGPNAFRNAMSITISARMALGTQGILGRDNRPFGSSAMVGRAGAAQLAAMAGRAGMGGRGGVMGIMNIFSGGDVEAGLDSLLTATMTNPVAEVLALGETLQLTDAQHQAIQPIADTLQATLDEKEEALRKSLQELAPLALAGEDVRQIMERFQTEVQPQITEVNNETRAAMQLTQQQLSAAQWELVPPQLRGVARAGRLAAGGFNALGMLDRMLANPIPVILEMRDTLQITQEQATRIQAISGELQEKLSQRRTELGQRFDNVDARQQARIFSEIQPQIEEGRDEARAALRAVQEVLTKEQWEMLPEQVRDPFRQVRRPRGDTR